MPLNDAAQAIKDACDRGVANPAWKPKCDDRGNVVTTYCNLFTRSVAEAAGYEGFADLTADEMVDLMSSSPEWGKLASAKDAAAAAVQGVLVVCGQKDNPHGHVNVIYPGGGLVFSGHWQTEAPTVANVGKENKIFGANYAFREPPSYFAWTKKTPDPDA